MNVSNLFVCEVTKNDVDEKGGVTIFNKLLMDGYTPSHYPTAYPFRLGVGTSDASGIIAPPEVGSFVWVFYEKPEIKKNPFYMADFNFKDTFLEASNIRDELESSYPDVKLIHFKNGVQIAVSSSDNTPEILLFHSSGNYIYLDKKGKTTISSRENTWNDIIKDLIGFVMDINTEVSGLGSGALIAGMIPVTWLPGAPAVINLATITTELNTLNTKAGTSL